MVGKSQERKPLTKGQKFGKLTVIEFDHKEVHYLKNGNMQCAYMYKFQCECGNICIKDKVRVVNGMTQSCGCLHREKMDIINKNNSTHRLSKTRLYRLWATIKARCYNSKFPNFNIYGGRGIAMCEEWRNNFMSFHDWAFANGYDETAKRGECTIDRVDVNGNYEPSNCRWVDIKAQSRNRRNNNIITYNGETHCIAEWAEILGIDKGLIIDRLDYGWSVEKTFKTPINNHLLKYTFKNKTQLLSEWAKELNIPLATLRIRLQDLKWTIEKAFTTPLLKQKMTYKGQTKTKKEWAKIYNMPVGTLKGRLNMGWSIKKALTTPIQKMKKIRCLETNKVYKNIKEVAKEFNNKTSMLYSCLNGYRKTAYGYHWEYVTGES